MIQDLLAVTPVEQGLDAMMMMMMMTTTPDAMRVHHRHRYRTSRDLKTRNINQGRHDFLLIAYQFQSICFLIGVLGKRRCDAVHRGPRCDNQ
jgi:hypothetical protein